MVRVSRTRSRISSARMALPPRRGSGRRAYSDRPLPARPGPRRLNESSFSGEGRAMRAMGGEERGDRRRTQILDAAELREGFSERVTEAYEAADAELARRARRGELGDLDPQLLTRVAAATGLGLLVLAILEEPVLAERWDELPEFLTRLWFDGLPRERG